MNISRRTMMWMSAAAAAVPRVLVASSSPVIADNAYHVNAIRERIPNPSLITHEGKRVRFYDDLVRGRTVMLNLMYTSCERSCPMTLANLVRVQRQFDDQLAKHVTMLSLTVDPAHDTPEVLREHAGHLGAGPGWLFVTGARADIDRIRIALGMYDAREQDTKTSHLNLLAIGNEPLGLWCAMPALSTAAEITRNVRRLARL